MSTKPDGGPAFASFAAFEDGSAEYHPGMSLRDYFAALAMQGIIARGGDTEDSRASIARIAYLVADAMIAGREK